MGKAGENVYGDQYVCVIVILLGKVNQIHKIHIPLTVNSRHYDPRPSLAPLVSTDHLNVLTIGCPFIVFFDGINLPFPSTEFHVAPKTLTPRPIFPCNINQLLPIETCPDEFALGRYQTF